METTLEESTFDEGAESGVEVIVWTSTASDIRTAWLRDEDELVIGRGDDCDLALPGPLSSRRHAVLRRSGTTWLVQDLDSRNGVSLNGESVTTAAITRGDVVRIGNWVGVYDELPTRDEPEYGVLAEGIYGGPVLRRLVEQLKVAAKSDISIVIQGATGTGKEELAKLVHSESRRTGAFIAINCAMYRGAMALSELFGYRKGAFPGAEQAHTGLIRSAQGGTLLLDEITDLAPEVQPQLLRVLEAGELVPLGESEAVPLDVRFVAATQEPLAAAVEAGRFRSDLQARLEGQCFRVPTLRERRADIPPLFLHLLREEHGVAPSVDSRVLERLCLYDWPLNVRELLALARRIATTHPPSQAFGLQQLEPLFSPNTIRTSSLTPAGRKRKDSRAFASEELAALKQALERHRGNVSHAAAELNISRQRAYRMLKKT